VIGEVWGIGMGKGEWGDGGGFSWGEERG